jgi:hypothetical protein
VVRSLPAESPAPTRARLTLNLPPNARVWLAGKAVDTAINPVVLESPDLEPDQRYTFDIRVTWSDSRGEQERQRTVTVGVGQSTSLTYNAVGGPPGQ